MHRKDLRGSRALIIRNGDEVLIPDQNQQSGQSGGSVGRPEPGKPTSDRFRMGIWNRRSSQDFAGSAEESGGEAQPSTAFGAGEVVFFVGVAFGRREFAQEVFLASLRLKSFIVVHRKSFRFV